MLNPQMTSSQMELLPLVCLCLLSWSGTTSADQHETVKVKQDDDAILKCSIDGSNIETAAFEWTKDGQTEVFSFDSGHHHSNGRTGQAEQFKGRVSHFQDELKHGNASIKITNTTMDDSGNYTCEFPNIQPSPTFHVKLVVGAAPKLSVKILDETETSALLQCEAHGVPELEVHWQDSDGNILPAEKPQVTNRGGLSYITRNTTVTKKGRFYCVATQMNISHTVSNEIYVRLPKTVKVKQDDDVILPCSIGSNIESVQFDWKKDGQTKKEVFLYNNGDAYRNGRTGQDEQFKGRVSHFKDELKHGNASIKITNTKVDDSGDYTCIFPNLQPPQTFNVKLVVGGVLKDRTGENITGAASRPFVTTVKTQGGVLLQCEVHGFPKPKVEWKDSSGNILPAEEPQVKETGGSYNIILRAPVTKAGHYRCVVTQEEISHQIYTETYVPMNEPVLRERPNIPGAALEPSVTILNTQDGVLLQCVVRRATPKPKVEWMDSSGNIVPAEEPQVTERGGSYDIILRAPVTKTDNFHCVVTQEEINHQISAEMYAQTSEPVLKERTGENIPGAAPKPFVTILDETETSALLQCKAHGVPDLEVHWQDSDGNKLTAEESQVTERGDHMYITLKTTVTKTDHFSCVATQMKLGHNISSQIYVRLTEDKPQSVTGYVGTIFGTLLVVAVVVVLYKCYTKQKQKKDEKQPEEKPKNQQNSEKQAEEIPMNQQNSEKQSDQEV